LPLPSGSFFRSWPGTVRAGKIREYLPPGSRQYGSRHFQGKLQLLDRIGLPFAPKVDEDLRQPPPEDPGPVHPGMAAGAERHQLVGVAGVAVMNV
jgi:hypothetical protein